MYGGLHVPFAEGACVNVGRAAAGNGEGAETSDHRSATPEPTVSVVKPSGAGASKQRSAQHLAPVFFYV